MTNTTNYGLNIVEGTDIVNPLTQFNPNFNSIDTIMKANADAAVTSASCIKSGTVHTITRTNTDAEMFVFTATGDWNTGDTMIVDGVTVTPVLPDGTALLTGSYLINSEVLASIKGTKVTIYSNMFNMPTINASDVVVSPGVTLDSALSTISADAIGPKGVGSFDADNKFTTGVYRNVSSGILHTPNDDANGILIIFPVYPAADGLKTAIQIYTNFAGDTWIRINWSPSTTSWSNWRKFTLS